MAGHENEVELMREYHTPQTLKDVHKYSFRGYGIFGIFVIGVMALTLYFV